MRLLNSAEAGEYLQKPAKTLANWRAIGKGPKYVKVGRDVRYRESDLDEWIETCIVDPRSA